MAIVLTAELAERRTHRGLDKAVLRVFGVFVYFLGVRAAVVLALMLAAVPAVAQPFKGTKRPDVRYVPSPDSVVEAMLELARVTASDVVYDLGSGDGRIPIAAAQRYGAFGVGVELDAKLNREGEPPSCYTTTEPPPERARSHDVDEGRGRGADRRERQAGVDGRNVEGVERTAHRGCDQRYQVIATVEAPTVADRTTCRDVMCRGRRVRCRRSLC